MVEPILSREAIALQAREDALEEIASGRPATCRYPEWSEAARAWRACLARYREELTAPEGAEGGA